MDSQLIHGITAVFARKSTNASGYKFNRQFVQKPFSSYLSLIVLLSWMFATPAFSQIADDQTNKVVQSVLHILDYVAVDYPGVIHDGKVTNSDEYAEQLEFAGRLVTLTSQLPAQEKNPQLLKQANQIRRAVQNKSAGEQVTKLCADLTKVVITTFDVKVAPRTAPILDGVSALFEENCAACHGVEGFGNGPNAASLEPKPANFHDKVRQQHRNVYSLYNTISLGVEGTAMPSFSQLTSQQRWQLAFYVSNFYADDVARSIGEAVWTDTQTNPAISTLQQLTQITPAQIEKIYGKNGSALLAYLRANPFNVESNRISPWKVARDSLVSSVAAYKKGDTESAYELAVAAYLEGIELVEAQLNTVAPELRKQIEREMLALRGMIKNNVDSVQLQDKQSAILNMIDEAQDKASSSHVSSAVNFFSALLILLREGIEAILILAAIAAVLIKTGRRESLRYIHYGWIGALVLGVVTWYVAVNFINISGANREITEGVTALVAAGMLIYVGFWLHKQTYAMQWKEFIRAKVSQSLSNGALTGLAAMAFIAVYREVFESVLFFQTLSLETGPSGYMYIAGGAVTAAAILVLLAWLIFKFSVRLPLKLFFQINSVFLYVLAILFAGKGIAALQVAGMVPVNSVRFVEIDALGIHPNLESLGAQLTMIVIAILLYLYSRNKINRRMLAD